MNMADAIAIVAMCIAVAWCITTFLKVLGGKYDK